MSKENKDIVSNLSVVASLEKMSTSVDKRKEEFKKLIEEQLKQKDAQEFSQMDWAIIGMGKIEEFLVDRKKSKEEQEEIKLFFNKSFTETLKKHEITNFSDLYEKPFPADKFVKKPANYVPGKAHINRFKELMRKRHLDTSDIVLDGTIFEMSCLGYLSNNFISELEKYFKDKDIEEIKNMTLADILDKKVMNDLEEIYALPRRMSKSILGELKALKYLSEVPLKDKSETFNN